MSIATEKLARNTTEFTAEVVSPRDTNGTVAEQLEERTRELEARNRELRLLRNHVDQGLLTLSGDGRLAHERSSIVNRWFGKYVGGVTFASYIGTVDPSFAEMFALAYEALLEGVLPRELCLQQLPRRIRDRGRQFRCDYVSPGPNAAPGEFLIVISDITLELTAARQEAEGAEILALFEAFSRDRAGLLAFVNETNEQVASLPSAPLDLQKRLIHTIKGNCSLMGISVVADRCHDLEEHIAELQSVATGSALAPLEQRWRDLIGALHTFGGDRGHVVLELPVKEVDQLERDIIGGAPVARIRERLASWRLEPAERPLSHLGSHARKLAARLGKGDLDVVIDAGDVHLAPPVWAAIWSDLVHVVRNAIDHGIESSSVRRHAGKPPRPQLRLVTRVRDGHLVIEVADDGAGIDWSAVKRVAVERGLPHVTEADLANAIFASDVTTRLEVTVTSGRGMGLAAVRRQVEGAGGSVAVSSTLGVGTVFHFRIPMPTAGLLAERKSEDVADFTGARPL